MSQAVPPQSTTHPDGVLRVPLLPLPEDPPVRAERPTGDGDPRFLHTVLLQRVFTAAGEVEAAEWELDQILDDAAVSGQEIGVGLDVGPVDGILESARWVLDQAVSTLHAEIRTAAHQGLPVVLLAEASALEAEEIRSVLAAAPQVARSSAGVLSDELAAAV